MANYGKKLRIGADIKRKEKVEKVMKFAVDGNSITKPLLRCIVRTWPYAEREE